MGVKYLCLMLLLHIIDDFHLQGMLKELKQKKWWIEQKGYKDLYKNDYMVALMAHSIQWAIMVHIPLFFTNIPNIALVTSLVINIIIHYYVDDLKCNKLKINLVSDQMVHFAQIWVTWVILRMLVI